MTFACGSHAPRKPFPGVPSIRILVLLFIFLGCSAVVVYTIYRFIRYGRISRPLIVIGSMAMLPLSAMIIEGVIEGDIELNPSIESRDQLIGVYSNGDQSLKLNTDGTFEAHGLFPTTSGTWSNRNWSLTLSYTGLEKPRIITRNGRLCIAPFYAGVDEPMGLLLKKESE